MSVFDSSNQTADKTSGILIGMHMTPEQQRQSIVESLRLVAAAPDEQVSALPDFVSVTDEVATSFGDAFLLAPQLLRGGLIENAAFEKLTLLDDWFTDMPADGSVADTESLYTHDFWRTSRKLAVDALKAMGQEPKPPNLSHVHWT